MWRRQLRQRSWNSFKVCRVEPIAPPDLALRDPEGKTHALDEAKGSAQLLVFWSMGCVQQNDLQFLQRPIPR